MINTDINLQGYQTSDIFHLSVYARTLQQTHVLSINDASNEVTY